MSNQIKLKRGSGSDPGTSDLVVGEVALRTDTGQLFTKKDDGNIEEIGAQAGISDGDKGDITVSNSGATFTIDNQVITNDKVNSSAAISGSKITPNFGSQNITTSGNLSVNGGQISISGSTAAINFADSDSNPDYRLVNSNGIFKIRDTTNGVDRLKVNTDGHFDFSNNVDFASGIDVTGSINATTDITLASTTSGQKISITKDGTEAAQLSHIGTGNEGILILKDGGTNTIVLHGDAPSGVSYFNAGNVAIGKTTASEKLDVSGNIAVTGNISATGNITITNTAPIISLVDTNANSDFEIKVNAGNFAINDTTNSENRFLIDSNGNIGIGTNTINDDAEHCKLVISGQSGTAAGVLIFQDTSNNEDGMVFADNGNLYIVADRDNTASNSKIIFRVDGSSQKMSLDSSGNLTISGTVDGVDIAARNTLFGGLTSSSGVLTNGVTATTQSAGDDSTKVATTAYADTAVANLVDSAPGTLNTLNELAAALGDDPNFATTVTNSIATKLPLAGGTLTGALNVGNGSANSVLTIKKADNNTADHIQFFNGTTRVGEIGVSDDTWLRINNQTNKNIFTPRFIRADGGFFVDGETKGINGSGNFVNGTIAGASDYGTLVRSDTSDTMNGTYTISTSSDQKLILAGSTNPYIRFQEGTTNKAYIQWDGSQLILVNQESSDYLRIGSGLNGLIYQADGVSGTVWHSGNDGGGSGLNADLLDSINATSFLRSDNADTAIADITFSGGAGAATIAANSDIRFTSGNWTGEATKIQHHSNWLYLQGGSSGFIFRHSDGTNRWVIDSGGAFRPNTDKAVDIGTTTHRVGTIHTGGLFLDNGTNAGRDIEWQPSNDRLAFLDNTKATFGDGADLSIFHDSSNSYISDQGTGSLILKSNTIDFTNAAQNEFLARFFQDSAVELYFNAEKKWETTADGVNLADNKLTFQGTANRNIIFRTGNNDLLYEFDAGDFYRQNIGNSTHEFFVGNTERLRVQDGSVYVNGSLGIGTTSPARALHMQSGSDFGIRLTKTAHSDAEIKNTSSLDLCCSSGGAGGQVVRILTGASPTSLNEQMRVAGTKVLIGMNSTQISSPNNPRMQVYQQMGIMAQDNANQRTALVFQNPAGRQGFINTNASGITIVGTSDYRVKENVNYSIDGITKIKQVKPCTFKFKADEENTIVHGFIAHELQSVLPEAVTGEKDEIVTQAKIDAGEYEQETLGNEVHQGVDAGKLIPLLTKALQETISKVEVLETEVATLKSS